jgi:phage-related minor tail protein
MTTTQPKNSAPSFDAAFEQVKDFNEQFLSAARKAGNLYVDSYEKAVDRAIDFERKVAGLSQQEWLKTLIDAQTDFAREVADSYATAARTLLK